MALNVNLTFDLAVTLALGSRSRNLDNNMAQLETHLCAKFHGFSPSSFDLFDVNMVHLRKKLKGPWCQNL